MTPKDKRQDSLRDAIEGDYPDAFRFDEPGTTLIGKITGFSKGWSKFGPHPVVQVQNEEDGEIVSVHCLHTALRSQMQNADPKPGDRIAIKYVGEAVTKSGKRQGASYKDFRVRVDSPTRTFRDVLADVEHDADDADMPF